MSLPPIDLLRLASLCVLLAGAETLHGIARTVLLAPRVGKALAVKLSIVSGSLIAKAVDRRVDPDSAWFEWTTRIDNAESARRAAEKWARALRSQLDVARASLPRNLESDLKRP